MKLALLPFVFALSAHAITVSNISFDGASHSTVGVRFVVDVRPQLAHIRYIASPGTCTSGSGGYVIGNGFISQDFSVAGEDPGFIRLDVSGLAPNTQYQFCPEVYNGSTWTSGVGAIFTTAPLPAIHPAPPIQPVTFDTSHPDTTGFTQVSVGPNCQSPSLQTLVLNAIGDQMNNGSVISIPAGTVCDGPVGTSVAQDLVYFPASRVDIATGTIATPSPHGLKERDQIVGVNFTGYGQTLPWGWQDGYVYSVHVVDATHFRISYPTYSDSTYTFLDAGAGNPAYYRYPRTLKPIVIRTATPDNQLPPEKTRISPAWLPKLATIRNNNPGFGLTNSVAFTSKRQSDWDANIATAVGNLRFVGINFTTGATPTDTTDPVPYHGYLEFRSADGPVTVDRCLFTHGSGPTRVNNTIGYQGHMMAIRDSYFDDLNFWHNTATGFDLGNNPQDNGGHSFWLLPGEFHSATLVYKMPAPITVYWSGTPTGNQQAAIYTDMQGHLTVSCPAGLTCTAGSVLPFTIEAANPSANSNCDRSDPVFPRNSQGRVAGAYLACWYVNPNASLNRLQRPNWSATDAPEGAQVFLAGIGPGPYLLENNYASGSGNWFHFDNAGYGLDRGDYVVRRNQFHFDMKHCYGGNPAYAGRNPQSDGLSYLHRWFLEWKGGQRAKIEGNFFDGSCADVETSGSLFHVVARDSGNVSDFDFRDNIFAHSGSLGAWIGPIASHTNPMSKPSARMRFQNNLAYDIDGWHYAAYESLAYQGGNGWYFQASGGVEDIEIDHNTFLPNIGLVPHILDGPVAPVEGFKFTNNVLSYNGTVGGGGTGIRSGGGDQYSSDSVPNCGSLQDKAFMDCVFTSGPGYTRYQFSGNVIYPGFGPSYSSPGTGQVDAAWLTGEFAGLADNIVPNTPGVQATLDTFGFTDRANSDFRLKPTSPLVSGSWASGAFSTTDHKSIGADMNELLAVAGTVQYSGITQVNSTSAVVLFVAPDSQSCPVDISSSDAAVISGFVRVADNGTTRSRSVTLSGLTPHTLYYGRINCAVSQPTFQFSTQ